MNSELNNLEDNTKSQFEYIRSSLHDIKARNNDFFVVVKNGIEQKRLASEVIIDMYDKIKDLSEHIEIIREYGLIIHFIKKHKFGLMIIILIISNLKIDILTFIKDLLTKL